MPVDPRFCRWLFVLLLALCASGCTLPERRQAGEGVDDCLRRHAVWYREHHGVPAVSMAVSGDGATPVAIAIGVTDPDRGATVTIHHRFRIASVSKPVTALAVMRLIEDGALSLESRVFGPDGVLGERYLAADADPRLRAITVRHLLEHSAGLDPGPPDPVFALAGGGIDALLNHALRAPLLDVPGRHHRYANLGYLLLGQVIEARAGMDYEDFVRATLLRPAGILGMRIGGNGRAARGADEVTYRGAGVYSIVRPTRMQAHGGWIATPGELLRMLAFVRGSPEAAAPISRDALRSMTTASAPPTARGETARYGLGWEVDARGYGHLGAMPGTVAALYQHDDGRAVAALANAQPQSDARGNGLWRIARRALDCL